MAELTGFSIRDLFRNRSTPSIKVYFSTFDQKVDFESRKFVLELIRGKRTLLFVSIPRFKEHVNRVVFGSALIYTVNRGANSMSSIQISTIFSNELRHKGLEQYEKESVADLSGQSVGYNTQRVGNRWIATWTIPRLDPMGGAERTISFLLNIHRSTKDGEFNKDVSGEAEIRVLGPDWVGVSHVLDIRCIPADSGDEFLALSKTMASSLRIQGYPDVPLILVETTWHVVPIQSEATVIQTKVHAFYNFTERTTLHNF